MKKYLYQTHDGHKEITEIFEASSTKKAMKKSRKLNEKYAIGGCCISFTTLIDKTH